MMIDSMTSKQILANLQAFEELGIIDGVLSSDPPGLHWLISIKTSVAQCPPMIVSMDRDDLAAAFILGVNAVGMAIARRRRSEEPITPSPEDRIQAYVKQLLDELIRRKNPS
jgi:hypothetical protein